LLFSFGCAMPLFATISSLFAIAPTAQLFGVNTLSHSSSNVAVNSCTRVETSVGKRVVAAAACIPDPEKAKLPGGCGEDSFFISKDVNTLGVADGVGGWRDKGVDSSKYSRCLMENAQQKADRASSKAHPLHVLEHAYNGCKDVMGSSTAAVLNVTPDYKMHGINVGDSGFMVIRDGAVILRTKEQQYSFNAPFQLGTGSDDTPATGDRYSVQLRPDDVVIMATDGMFDNLFDSQILHLVNRWDSNAAVNSNPTRLARELADAASQAARGSEETPFERNSGGRFPGGKLDDITVVVARIQ